MQRRTGRNLRAYFLQALIGLSRFLRDPPVRPAQVVDPENCAKPQGDNDFIFDKPEGSMEGHEQFAIKRVD